MCYSHIFFTFLRFVRRCECTQYTVHRTTQLDIRMSNVQYTQCCDVFRFFFSLFIVAVLLLLAAAAVAIISFNFKQKFHFMLVSLFGIVLTTQQITDGWIHAHHTYI